ncbi:hypothetical protein N9C89_14025 [Halocynthiibacter sp. SDUM655004]|uniref:Uncharacterized protein n=1 Tax=Halocynthiibacter halioticoli TaxID=2986804 RepID=A0AAE3LUT1_9RHOB|nr:hypothetical protein [Halocynthiibacter halioticoli]MCW4058676.1 hypothetical protein [Halocynthiibacter sp. SDUM655004]
MTKAKGPPIMSLVKDQQADPFQFLGGSIVGAWNDTLLNQTMMSVWARNSPPETQNKHFDATLAAMAGMEPKDELEAMMNAQLVAAHNATMEFYRRASQTDQSFEGTCAALNQATKLSRNFARLVEVRDKHRGKGQQKVTVEHVHVHAGGQAVVGVVEHAGGGGQNKLEEQPHAQHVTYAFEPAVWCEDAGRNALPIPSDGEWSMPNAWREITGGTEEEF